MPTTLLSQKLSPVSITSSILCTQSVLSFTGMLVKVWKRENSLKLVRILLLLKRITKRLLWTLKKNTKNLLLDFCCVYDVWWKVYGKSFFENERKNDCRSRIGPFCREIRIHFPIFFLS